MSSVTARPQTIGRTTGTGRKWLCTAHVLNGAGWGWGVRGGGGGGGKRMVAGERYRTTKKYSPPSPQTNIHLCLSLSLSLSLSLTHTTNYKPRTRTHNTELPHTSYLSVLGQEMREQEEEPGLSFPTPTSPVPNKPFSLG